jgi:hypothetical protein
MVELGGGVSCGMVELGGSDVPCGVPGSGILGGVGWLVEVEWRIKAEGNRSSIGRQTHLFHCTCHKKSNRSSVVDSLTAFSC